MKKAASIMVLVFLAAALLGLLPVGRIQPGAFDRLPECARGLDGGRVRAVDDGDAPLEPRQHAFIGLCVVEKE